MEITHVDVTDEDLDMAMSLAFYIRSLRPPRGEYVEFAHYWDHTPGVRYMIERVFAEAASQGFPWKLVLTDTQAFVTNTLPITWWYRLRMHYDTFRGRPRKRKWD